MLRHSNTQTDTESDTDGVFEKRGVGATGERNQQARGTGAITSNEH